MACCPISRPGSVRLVPIQIDAMEQQIAHLLAPPYRNLTLARGGTQPVRHLDATAAIVGRPIPCRRLHLGDLCAGGGFPFRLQPPFQARFH